MLAVIPVTIHVSDTYFIVAHIHYVLFGGSLFTIFAGVYYWFPKMTGRMYDERLGKIHFWSTFVFFNLTFAPMHVIGIQGMPRRVADYAEQWATWNLMISIASFFLGLSALVFAYNMIASWRGGPHAESNPWRALTLEWQVTSPPPIFNFDAVPTVVGGPYEYGVPGAVHGVLKGGAEVPQPAGATAHGGGGASATATRDAGVRLMPHILVVANQTIGGAKLLELVRERAKQDDTSFTLVVPMTKPRSGYVIYDDAVRDSAQVRLDLTLSYLRGEDVVASGELGDEDPFTATLDAIHEYHPDEVIISTLPHSSSGWLRRDLIERIQDAANAPVTHVISDMDAEGLPFEVTLVVANVTAGRGTLRARMKEIAAEHEDMLFIVVVPLESPRRRPRGRRRARAAGQHARSHAPRGPARRRHDRRPRSVHRRR